MNQITLKNSNIQIVVNTHGAELRSILNLTNQKEYLWNADPKYWNRSSPVLFPFVGAVKDNKYRHNSVTYPMNQHGFARDMDFELIQQSEDEAWFTVTSTEETFQKYPFHFKLEIGYKLEDKSIVVMWRVTNTNDYEMHFSIGAHPAFMCPINKDDKQSEYYLKFSTSDGNSPDYIRTTVFGNGCVTTEKKDYDLDDGILAITEDRFDGDALVIENNQVQRVSLLDKNKKEYIFVQFTSPLVGVWSPPKKQAPFVCIEPWYGRCDCETFEGELKDREWGNVLNPKEKFYAEYRIIITE